MAQPILHQVRALLHDKGNRFVVQIVGVYVFWKALYYFIENSRGWLGQGWKKIVDVLGIVYAEITHQLLGMMGVQTIRIANTLHHIGTKGTISMDEHCLAIPAMFIFSACIFLFSGSLKNKLWFIPIGILGIAAINISRMIILGFVYIYLPRPFFVFHHSFVFIIVTYSLVFLLIRFWMKYLSDQQISNA